MGSGNSGGSNNGRSWAGSKQYGGKGNIGKTSSIRDDACAVSRGAMVAGAVGTQVSKDTRTKAASAAVGALGALGALGAIGQNKFCN